MSRIEVVVDRQHGGRWTSLRGKDGREWLWRRHAPQRNQVQPGAPFIDAGGLEECFPTVTGVPDHGEVWSRPWTPDGDGLSVAGDWYRLHRRFAADGEQLTAHYRLDAESGRRFIWAAHALLDLSTSARLTAPPGHPTEAGTNDGLEMAAWPWVLGTDVSRVGPADGSVLMLFLPGLSTITVADRSSLLRMTLQVTGQPIAIGIWRNLGGWPSAAPYRSIGIEPMLGQRAGLATAPLHQVATVPRSGLVEWSLTIVAQAAAD